MQPVTRNIRYLLWREKVERAKWVTQLAQWAGCNLARAETLLRNAELRKDEQECVAAALGVTEEDLLFAHLLEDSGTDILRENIGYLLDTLDHGQKKMFAADLEVHGTTVSRWRSGLQVPERSKLVAICHYFRLPAGTDLATEPIFLSPLPISEAERKAWLHRHIEEMDARTLSELFSALQRLLGGE